MNVYENSYFNLSVPFSEGWRYRSWSNWKEEPKDQGQMQRYDDDISSIEGEYKILFSAFRLPEKTPRLISSSQFSMAVYFNENKFDLNTMFLPEKNHSSRIFETGNLFGKHTQVLTIKHSHENYILTHKIIAWQAQTNLWISASMAGDNDENFEEALVQFNGLKCVLN